MAEEVSSRMVHQAPMQLCVLGKSLASDANFLEICRGFQVKNKNSEAISLLLLVFGMTVPSQVAVLTSEDGWD